MLSVGCQPRTQSRTTPAPPAPCAAIRGPPGTPSGVAHEHLLRLLAPADGPPCPAGGGGRSSCRTACSMPWSCWHTWVKVGRVRGSCAQHALHSSRTAGCMVSEPGPGGHCGRKLPSRTPLTIAAGARPLYGSKPVAMTYSVTPNAYTAHAQGEDRGRKGSGGSLLPSPKSASAALLT